MTARLHLRSLVVGALLCCTAAVALLQTAHAGQVVSGASGPLPDCGGDGGAGRWSWSYLDATPADASFPFRLGVADRDQRDRHGGRFVPAIRYAHGAVALGDEMIITHGSETFRQNSAKWPTRLANAASCRCQQAQLADSTDSSWPALR